MWFSTTFGRVREEVRASSDAAPLAQKAVRNNRDSAKFVLFLTSFRKGEELLGVAGPVGVEQGQLVMRPMASARVTALRN